MKLYIFIKINLKLILRKNVYVLSHCSKLNIYLKTSSSERSFSIKKMYIFLDTKNSIRKDHLNR